jgi:hypothetical protein
MKTRIKLLATTLTVFAAAACDDLPPGDITDPWYWGNAFLKKYEEELVVGQLEPGPAKLATPRVVLLITGVTIPAEWFEPIEARLTRDGFIPVVYEPPDLLSGDLEQNSKWLGNVVEQVKLDYNQDTIDILAECTGGVIARHYIQSLGGAKNVSRMVTFISPQHGVAKAPMAYGLAGWPALHDLSPGSDFLNAVNNAPLPADVAFTSIYSCTDEYIQPYTTSIIPGAKNIGLCNGFVGHYEFFYNPDIYLIMHAELVAPAPKDVASGSGGTGAGGTAGNGVGGIGAGGESSGGTSAGSTGGSAGMGGTAGSTEVGENAGSAGNAGNAVEEPGQLSVGPDNGCSVSGPVSPNTGGIWLSLGALAFAWQRRRATRRS